jgi:hypothetical protein
MTLPACADLSGALHPPPLSGTRCGLPTLLSAMTRVARRVPGVVGMKRTYPARWRLALAHETC